MFKNFLTLFTATGISLLAVTVDTYKGFKLNRAYAAENNDVTQSEFEPTKDGQTYLYSSTIYDTTATELYSSDKQAILDAIAFDLPQSNLGEILAPNAEVEKVAAGFEFIEGPVWHPDGFLLFSDIPANTIYKWQPRQKNTIFRQPSGNANGNTLDKSGRLVSAEHGNRRVSRTEKDGEIITLVSQYEGKRLNSPNDLVVKSDSSIYFTDPPYGIKSEQEELGFYGVYRLAPDGTLTLLVDDFVRPNGIALSPDETKLYVNDSQEGHIRVFEVKSDGSLENGQLFAELKPPSELGAADGMKVDIKGNVYSTGPGGVWVFSPNGELLGIIETPEVTTNLAWGDRDYQTLYITANTSLYRIPLKIPGIR